ncbi:MAG: hypothetical protein PHS12_05770 [Candidatus Omnitrophica bacterium]|jgi:hypothetical protein|nr:hypothetical protein [Candidatus Omnitrophota bacterium]MDD4982241.1 hypothetical protein [Candidatus Omnitrophota bacterium]
MILKRRNAQAVLELAILGSIIIAAFALAIKHSERYNRELSYMQQTFRATLKKAKEINNTASWQSVDFRRMPNVTNPMELGELEQFSSSNNVLWSDGKTEEGAEEEEGESWFELNRSEQTQIPNRDPLYNTTETTSFSFSSNANSTTNFDKNEQGTRIVTHKSLNATDTIGGSSDVDGTSVSLGSSLGEGGVYSGGGINRSRSMQ